MGGGRHGVSDRFASGFWYMNSLGLLATRYEHKVFLRQDLVGGGYGLLRDRYCSDFYDSDQPLSPNVDYFVALLWKRLCGRGVLVTTCDDHGSEGVTFRAFAFCSREHDGGVVLPFLNTLSTSRELSLHVDGAKVGAAAERVEYHITAPSLNSSVGLLNGVPLQLADGRLPEMPGRRSAAPAAVRVAGRSFGFVALPQAGVAACRRAPGAKP